MFLVAVDAAALLTPLLGKTHPLYGRKAKGWLCPFAGIQVHWLTSQLLRGLYFCLTYYLPLIKVQTLWSYLLTYLLTGSKLISCKWFWFERDVNNFYPVENTTPQILEIYWPVWHLLNILISAFFFETSSDPTLPSHYLMS